MLTVFNTDPNGNPQPRVPTPEINPGSQPNEYQPPNTLPNANPAETPMEVPPVHE